MNNVSPCPLFNKETRHQGIALSGGIAFGKVCFANIFENAEVSDRKISPEQIETELERFDNACHAVISMMAELYKRISAKIGKPEAAIINAQMMIVQDPQLHKDINDLIQNGLVSAERAVSVVLNKYAERFHAIEDVYFKERANDIEDIRHRLLAALGHLNSSLSCADGNECDNSNERIIAAKELTPLLTFKLSPNSTFGFITQHGGVNSHAAILARALNIPAVSGINDLMSCLLCGQEVIINGNTGEIIISPSDRTKKALLDDSLLQKEDEEHEPPLANFKVMATISKAEDAEVAASSGAEGVGLYRTEYEFLGYNRILSEKEQLDKYLTVINSFPEAPVYFRMLDIGGDKNARWIDVPPEPNPYLGLRGSRLLLKRPDLFIPQARALARTSGMTGRTVYVMYPMVINASQFIRLKNSFNEAVQGIDCSIKHGLMFETPAASLQADEIMKIADFATVGTNDLTQYLLAVDRNNELVADEYNSEDPVMWSLIEKMAFAASFNNKPLSICGDLASNAQYFPQIVKSGIRCISVYPRKVNELRKELKSFNV